MGRILISIGERRPDRGTVANGIDKSVSRCSLCWWSRDCIANPCIASAVHRKDKDHEKEREVARSEAVRRHKDDPSHNRDGNGVDEEPEAISNSIGHKTVSKSPESDEDVRWRSQKQRHDVGIAQCSSQCREEVLEPSCTRDTHVSHSQDVGLRICHGFLEPCELRHGSRTVDVCLSCIDRHSTVCDVLQFWRKFFPSVREIRQDKYDDNTNSNGNRSFDNVAKYQLARNRGLRIDGIHTAIARGPCLIYH